MPILFALLDAFLCLAVSIETEYVSLLSHATDLLGFRAAEVSDANVEFFGAKHKKFRRLTIGIRDRLAGIAKELPEQLYL